MHIPVRSDLYLSPVQWTDKAALIEHINHPDISRNTSTIPFPYKDENADFWLNKVANKTEFDPTQQVLAIRKEEGGMIGAIGVHLEPGMGGHRREIGYWLGAQYWGQGIVTDALIAFSDWLFANTDLVRLEAKVYSFNPASKRVLEKAGYTLEGFMEKYHEKNGELIDAYILARLRK